MQVLHTLFQDKRTKFDASDKFGDNIMHFAARAGQLECLEYLIKRCRKLMSRENQEGKTPLRLAIEGEHTTCAAYLRNEQAPHKQGNRTLLVKAMAEQLVSEYPDYTRSVVSKQKDPSDRPMAFLSLHRRHQAKEGRYEVELRQRAARKHAEIQELQRQFDAGEFKNEEALSALQDQVNRRVEELSRMHEEVARAGNSPARHQDF